jgi:hypothetical protein
MQQKPKAQKMGFKTVSYLLGNFSQMTSYLYKPVQRSQENEQVSQNISNELRILKGSSRITSTNDIEVKKARRFSEDPFKDNQHDISVSSLDCANEVSPVVEQEGSSTSDDTSLESIIEANLEEDQNETEA